MVKAATALASSDARIFDARAGASRSAWVYERLRRSIQEGRYGGGDRVREEEIAGELGVSRTPVREALTRLQISGLLEAGPGGLVVAALNHRQIIELYELRSILEGSAASFAAQHASESEIGALERIADSFARAGDDPLQLAYLNRELHSGIYEAAHNRYLLRTLNELHDVLSLLPSTTFVLAGRPQQATKEHARILTAIAARDAEAADAAARRHIAKAQEARLTLLFDQTRPSKSGK